MMLVLLIKDIVDIGIDKHSWWMKPYPLYFITLLIDDLLATGGTARGAHGLIEKVGGQVVGIGFVVELGFLGGRAKLDGAAEVFSLLSY
jgi:hypothetical protein